GAHLRAARHAGAARRGRAHEGAERRPHSRRARSGEGESGDTRFGRTARTSGEGRGDRAGAAQAGGQALKMPEERAMRERGEDADIMGEIKTLSAAPRPVPEADAVASVVEAVLASLSGEMSIADLKLYHELQQLARYIAAAKREIAAIEPSDIN